MQGSLIFIRPGSSLSPPLLAPLLFILPEEAEKQNALLGRGRVSSGIGGGEGRAGVAGVCTAIRPEAQRRIPGGTLRWPSFPPPVPPRTKPQGPFSKTDLESDHASLSRPWPGPSRSHLLLNDRIGFLARLLLQLPRSQDKM